MWQPDTSRLPFFFKSNMDITINGKTYKFEVGSWWGPLYVYEDIMDIAAHPERKFNPAITLHLHVMLYCVLLSDNDGLDLTLDEFLAALDDLELCACLKEFYARRVTVLTAGRQESEPVGSKKKS